MPLNQLRSSLKEIVSGSFKDETKGVFVHERFLKTGFNWDGLGHGEESHALPLLEIRNLLSWSNRQGGEEERFEQAQNALGEILDGEEKSRGLVDAASIILIKGYDDWVPLNNHQSILFMEHFEDAFGKLGLPLRTESSIQRATSGGVAGEDGGDESENLRWLRAILLDPMTGDWSDIPGRMSVAIQRSLGTHERAALWAMARVVEIASVDMQSWEDVRHALEGELSQWVDPRLGVDGHLDSVVVVLEEIEESDGNIRWPEIRNKVDSLLARIILTHSSLSKIKSKPRWIEAYPRLYAKWRKLRKEASDRRRGEEFEYIFLSVFGQSQKEAGRIENNGGLSANNEKLLSNLECCWERLKSEESSIEDVSKLREGISKLDPENKIENVAIKDLKNIVNVAARGLYESWTSEVRRNPHWSDELSDVTDRLDKVLRRKLHFSILNSDRMDVTNGKDEFQSLVRFMKVFREVHNVRGRSCNHLASGKIGRLEGKVFDSITLVANNVDAYDSVVIKQVSEKIIDLLDVFYSWKCAKCVNFGKINRYSIELEKYRSKFNFDNRLDSLNQAVTAYNYVINGDLDGLFEIEWINYVIYLSYKEWCQLIDYETGHIVTKTSDFLGRNPVGNKEYHRKGEIRTAVAFFALGLELESESVFFDICAFLAEFKGVVANVLIELLCEDGSGDLFIEVGNREVFSYSSGIVLTQQGNFVEALRCIAGWTDNGSFEENRPSAKAILAYEYEDGSLFEGVFKERIREVEERKDALVLLDAIDNLGLSTGLSLRVKAVGRLVKEFDDVSKFLSKEANNDGVRLSPPRRYRALSSFLEVLEIDGKDPEGSEGFLILKKVKGGDFDAVSKIVIAVELFLREAPDILSDWYGFSRSEQRPRFHTTNDLHDHLKEITRVSKRSNSLRGNESEEFDREKATYARWALELERKIKTHIDSRKVIDEYIDNQTLDKARSEDEEFEGARRIVSGYDKIKTLATNIKNIIHVYDVDEIAEGGVLLKERDRDLDRDRMQYLEHFDVESLKAEIFYIEKIISMGDAIEAVDEQTKLVGDYSEMDRPKKIRSLNSVAESIEVVKKTLRECRERWGSAAVGH